MRDVLVGDDACYGVSTKSRRRVEKHPLLRRAYTQLLVPALSCTEGTYLRKGDKLLKTSIPSSQHIRSENMRVLHNTYTSSEWS